MLSSDDDDDDDNGPEKTYKLSCGHLYPYFCLSVAFYLEQDMFSVNFVLILTYLHQAKITRQLHN